MTVKDPLLEAAERAPVDDEPSTPEEDQAAADAWAEYERGEAMPLHKIRDEFEWVERVPWVCQPRAG